MNYKKEYDQLIQKGKERITISPCECHHILPRSMGGLDNPENLVQLSLEEHLYAHFLLWKIHNNEQMAMAFRYMCDLRNITEWDHKYGIEYKLARLKAKTAAHKRNGWLDYILWHPEHGKVTLSENLTSVDFTKKYITKTKFASLGGGVRLVLLGRIYQTFNWKLADTSLYSFKKAKPKYITEIATKRIEYCQGRSHFAQITGKPGGGDLSRVLKGYQPSARGWRLSTKKEINEYHLLSR